MSTLDVETLLGQRATWDGQAGTPANSPPSSREGGGSASPQAPFFPTERETFDAMGLPESLIESLVLKHLLAVGSNTGRGICRDLGVPGKPTLAMLAEMKNRQLVVYKGAAAMGDFEYALTEQGRERARKYLEENTYHGTAPVTLADYVASVHAQSLAAERPTRELLAAAFADLLVNESMLDRLGPAVNSGRGLFLYGSPGNGKTSIAERITACFGTCIWIPRALYVDGQIILFYDPQCHEAAEIPRGAPGKTPAADPRWVLVRRPTIVVGGELTMEALELRHNPVTHVSEPSVQLKSNGGTLVIDDFGRQRMSPVDLLNRWIVPLEKRYDYLTLANGKKIQVPFDQLIIFSTNLEPKQLVDDAFLRRIPYKINVADPAEDEFRKLFELMAKRLDVLFDGKALDHLITTHYYANNRPFRCCHPRDLLLQIIHQARYLGERPAMTPEGFDRACETYFAVFN